jgi:hypothetical protein
MPVLSRWLIRAALVYLAAGFSLGALMLVFKAFAHHGWMSFLLAPHIEFLLVGWTMQLTIGVAFWILPRFEGGASRGAVGYAWLAFVLLNIGVLLVGVASGMWASDSASLAGRVAEAGAALSFGIHAWRRIKGERSRHAPSRSCAPQRHVDPDDP